MTIQIAEFTLSGERDASWAAQRARLLASLAQLPGARRIALGKAVAEASRQTVNSGGGTVTFALILESEPAAIEVVVRAQSSTEGEFGEASSAKSGIGRLVDDLRFERNAEGSIIRLRQSLPPGAKPPDAEISQWGTFLAARTTQGALATSQSQVRELTERLRETQRRGDELAHQLEQIRNLNETLELLALVASKTVNAVVIMDSEGVIEWVNEGFERMTGHGSADVRGTEFSDFLATAEGDGDVAVELREAFQSGHGISLELKHARRDEQSYWASLSVTPVFDDDGRTTRWIGIANDVTRRREAQEELRKARDLAESANRAKSMFLANISHDIRTPMGAILGMTDLALDTELTREQREFLTTVKSSATALLGLLNDLLDLSKIEAGRIPIYKASFSLVPFLEAALKPHLHHAKAAGLKLHWTCDPAAPAHLVGDEGRLRQILDNLVGNAIKFTERGEVRVAVDCQWRSGPEVSLHFVVEDSGIGISADKLHSIFEAFTQAESSTSRRFGGTGLGLTICAHLAELMGGRIWVESELGEGSRFHFTVRLAASDEPAPIIEPAEPVSASPTRRLRVLVADDHPPNRVLVESILTKRGHSVTCVENGVEALRRVENSDFDAALLDVQMPEMDGIEATARLRGRERRTSNHLPVIAVTAFAMQGDRERCLAAGMDGYVTKPINASELIAQVESLAAGKTVEVLPSASDPTIPDFSAAIARLEGDLEIFDEQAELFLNDSPTMATRIRRAISEGDTDELRTASHRLRGFATCFDAMEVVESLARLERMGLEADLSEAESVCGEFETALAELRVALQQHLRPRAT